MRLLASTLEDAYLEAVGGGVSGALIVARYALREAVRRRVILVVLVLTVGFLGALRARLRR